VRRRGKLRKLMPLSRSRSPERDYVVRCLAEAKARPSLGELPALLEKVATPIGVSHLVADRVR
jgi:hypothetical protein